MDKSKKGLSAYGKFSIGLSDYWAQKAIIIIARTTQITVNKTGPAISFCSASCE
jgi:hypothetical protein